MRILIPWILSTILCLGCEEHTSQHNDTSLVDTVHVQESSIIKSHPTHAFILNEWQEGDIIFQTSLSAQSKAIQLATHSQYSHMGIIFKETEEWYVYEAIQPVKMTKLENWIARGEAGRFVVKRLKKYQEGINATETKSLKEAGWKYKGKDYDLHFGWGDESIYCSELVWKIYHEGLDIKLCELRRLEEFDLSHESVQNKLAERYGNQIPLDEQVVSPEDIFQSALLVEIAINR